MSSAPQIRRLPPATRPQPLLALFSLSALAVAEPLLSWLRQSPALARCSAETLIVYCAVLLLLPLVPAAVIVVARRVHGGAAAAIYHGSLAVLWVLGAARLVGMVQRPLTVAGWSAAAAAGVCAALAAARMAALRRVVPSLAVALAAVPASFFLHPEVSAIMSGLSPPWRSPPPVVVVVCEGLGLAPLLTPALEIDGARYPALAELAGRATWFRNATAVSDDPGLALGALLTGDRPDRGLAFPHTSDRRTLLTVMDFERIWLSDGVAERLPPIRRGLDARIPAAPAAGMLASGTLRAFVHILLPRIVSDRVPAPARLWDRDTGRRPVGGGRGRELEALLADLEAGSEPDLVFLYLDLPASPWELLPGGSRYDDPAAAAMAESGRWPLDEARIGDGYARYVYQARYLDHRLAELVAGLRQRDRFESSLIVVTSTRGTGFGPGDAAERLTETNAGGLLPVPLLLKAPHQDRAEISDHPVSAVDLLPTILDLLGRRCRRCDGRSAFAGGERPPRPAIGRQLAGLEIPSGLVSGALPESVSYLARLAGAHGRDPLVGRPLATFGSASASPASWVLGPSPEPMPGEDVVFVSGRLTAPIAGKLAIAAGGAVAAVTRPLSFGAGGHWFSAFVPAAAVPGRGLEVFEVVSPEPQPLLRRLQIVEAGGDRLEIGADGAVSELVLGGRRVALGEGGGGLGYIDGMSERDGRQIYLGWAADLDARRPVGSILVFEDGRLRPAEVTRYSRQDVAAHYRAPELLQSGIRIRFRRWRPDGRVRIFAVTGGGAAGELPWLF